MIPLVFAVGFIHSFSDNGCRKWRSRSRRRQVDDELDTPKRNKSMKGRKAPVIEMALVAGLFLAGTLTPLSTGSFLADWGILVLVAVALLNRRALAAMIFPRPPLRISLGGRRIRRVFK